MNSYMLTFKKCVVNLTELMKAWVAASVKRPTLLEVMIS